MSKIAIIAAENLLGFGNFQKTHSEKSATPYGSSSAALQHGFLQGKEIIMLARNGVGGRIPPHLINYRANISALAQSGAQYLISLSPATGIRPDLAPGTLVIPNQLIDYTYGREQTYFADDFNAACHIDFRHPYTERLRQALLSAASDCDFTVREEAVCGITQGPRLETLAEINRFDRDGCDLLGMTAMPETILAHELKLEYACLHLVTNKAAGRPAGNSQHSQEALASTLKEGLERAHQLIEQTVLLLGS